MIMRRRNATSSLTTSSFIDNAALSTTTSAASGASYGDEIPVNAANCPARACRHNPFGSRASHTASGQWHYTSINCGAGTSARTRSGSARIGEMAETIPIWPAWQNRCAISPMRRMFSARSGRETEIGAQAGDPDHSAAVAGPLAPTRRPVPSKRKGADPM
jgi:hypothetical protein